MCCVCVLRAPGPWPSVPHPATAAGACLIGACCATLRCHIPWVCAPPDHPPTCAQEPVFLHTRCVAPSAPACTQHLPPAGLRVPICAHTTPLPFLDLDLLIHLPPALRTTVNWKACTVHQQKCGGTQESLAGSEPQSRTCTANRGVAIAVLTHTVQSGWPILRWIVVNSQPAAPSACACHFFCTATAALLAFTLPMRLKKLGD